jgi:hypothetical protein
MYQRVGGDACVFSDVVVDVLTITNAVSNLATGIVVRVPLPSTYL